MAAPPFVFGSGSSEVFIVTQIAIMAFSILLMALSVTAYRNRKSKNILYAIAIFALFAIQHIINYVDAQVIDVIPDDMRYALFSVITMFIMVLFFISIVKK